MARMRTAPPPAGFERSTRRHRHPKSPRIRCGAQIIPLEDGWYQQRGKRVRTCGDCHKRIAQRDVV